MWLVIAGLAFLAVRVYDENHPVRKHPCDINPNIAGCDVWLEDQAQEIRDEEGRMGFGRY